MIASRGHVTPLSCRTEQIRAIEQTIEPSRRMPKQGQLLLQVNVDTAKEDRRIVTHPLRIFIEHERQVHGQQRSVVTRLDQSVRQRVIAHARATVIATSSRGKKDDFHLRLIAPTVASPNQGNKGFLASIWDGGYWKVLGQRSLCDLDPFDELRAMISFRFANRAMIDFA